MPRTHPDFFANSVMNYQLGGSFNGVLNMILREEKGFTYGAGSGFSGSLYPGTFQASSSVMTAATRESVEIFRDEIARYGRGSRTRTWISPRTPSPFPTPCDSRPHRPSSGMLSQIATYDLPFDYVGQEEAIVRGMTIDRHRESGPASIWIRTG